VNQQTDIVNTNQQDANTAVKPQELSDREYLQQEVSKRELARRSFKRYLYYVHAPSWKRTRMSDFLADEVQKFVETETGNAYDILLIQTPPQHGKSLTITESFPSWYLGRFPKNRIIEASYNFDTAERFGRKNLEKVEQYGSILFGMEKGSVWTKTEFELSNGWGRMISRGIMAGITGNPANLLIIDDPIKNREEADSQTYRDKLWAEWQNTLKSRLAAGAKVIVIMTPWHEDDLSARMLQKEPTTRLLRLPVEAEENDAMGREIGAPLAPELGKDAAWLKQFKEGYVSDPKQGGLRAWQALYQCSPRVEGGNMVRREWWKYYNSEEVRDFGTTVISVDAAFKGKENNDFVAIQVWSKRGNDYYLRYSLNQHLEFPETVQAILTAKRLFPETRYVLIEDKANGSAIIQTLQRQIIGVVGITPKGGKVARVNAVAPAIESGHVYLPADTLWAEALVEQFTAFPAGAHDDMVDACSQCLGYLLFASGTHTQLPEARLREIADEASVASALTSSSAFEAYEQYGSFDNFQEE
jgi:predicted phage terminase large subunit-like protein